MMARSAANWHRRMALATAIGGLVVLGPLPAAAVVLDWSAVSWPSGSLSQTITGVDPNNPGSSVTISISGDTSAFRSGYPVNAAAPITGGTLGDTNLQLVLRFPNTASNITVSVQFNYGGAGVQDVQTTLFDIDNGKNKQGQVVYVDQISGIQGQLSTNAPVAATVTNLPGSPTYTVANNGTLNATITGIKNNRDRSGNGNATLDFGTNLINQFSFTYGNGSGVQAGPNQQAIGVFDISWLPVVPEKGPSAAAIILCALAVTWRAGRGRRQPGSSRDPGCGGACCPSRRARGRLPVAELKRPYAQ
ncbi:MAG: hypothetical protein KGS61_02610 [Verrucomicrobia bacterium]|nr:hypothetical protein [Verrucomicrobiota bacterium]